MGSPSSGKIQIRHQKSRTGFESTSGTVGTLFWTSANVNSCTASIGWDGTKAIPSGSESTGSITSSRSYKLQCDSASDIVTVNVTPANNNGNAMSPPPSIAVRIFFSFLIFCFVNGGSLYGISRPANSFACIWNFASFIICLLFHTA